MLDREKLVNAFTPSTEVADPGSFAGRRGEVRQLAEALLDSGSVPVVYGARGLGKTSLALQVARIALGDVELLEALGLREHALRAERAYLVFWVTCSDAVKDKDALLQKVINTAEGFLNYLDLDSKRLVGETSKSKINLKFIEHETERRYDATGPGNFSSLDTEDKLQLVLERAAEIHSRRVLVVIDEIDRVDSTLGLASFIKNTSSEWLKFLLVGVCQNVSELLEDHSSLERVLLPVHVPPMMGAELEEIVRKALAKLQREDPAISFSEDARRRTAASAGGFPWFVHVIGQSSLVRAWDSRRKRVEEWDVASSLVDLATNRFAQQFSDLYQKAIRSSQQREILLRLLAKWGLEDVPVGEFYPLATSLGVTNPAAAKKQLCSQACGGVLVRPPGYERGVVRFRNAMFKRYVDLRPSMYQYVKERVDAAWDERNRQMMAAQS